MHRVILGITDERLVDHVDRNGLNNRRSNLREANRTQNIANTGPYKGNISGFKGVSYDKERNLWKAQIRVEGRSKCIGRFVTPEEAARAYDELAFAAWGEFAYLNQDHHEHLCSKLVQADSEVA
ncbi:AP2 domain-containing protein [Phyllobacterium sp. 22229]|uniref:AP2 domain-containing protein n=1 Tax=Phyllobacterium sp. 22229 TaxID=3453895 RepID=UPI003F85F790